MSAGVSELEHVLVLSDDIDTAREFYESAVGLRAGDRPPLPFDGYWLYAGTVPCLHIADRASYRTHAATLGLSVDGRRGDGLCGTAGHDLGGARPATPAEEGVGVGVPSRDRRSQGAREDAQR